MPFFSITLSPPTTFLTSVPPRPLWLAFGTLNRLRDRGGGGGVVVVVVVVGIVGDGRSFLRPSRSWRRSWGRLRRYVSSIRVYRVV